MHALNTVAVYSYDNKLDCQEKEMRFLGLLESEFLASRFE